MSGYYLPFEDSNIYYKKVECPSGQQTINGCSCINCLPGFYSNEITNYTCVPCDYSILPGAANCQQG
jgi:hypothetical protein